MTKQPMLVTNADITQLSTLYSNAIARAEKAEEALQFYANPENWDDAYFVEDEPNCITAVMSTIANDQGKKARAALILPPPPVRETP